MGLTAWDPTGPIPEVPTVTITVSGIGSPPVTEKATVTATVTEIPSELRTTTTVTATITSSPKPKPQTTKTVYRTREPNPVPLPVVTAPTTGSTRLPMEEWEFATPIPSVANPVSSQPQIVVQIPAQPVATDGQTALWTVILIVGAIALAALGFVIYRVSKGKW